MLFWFCPFLMVDQDVRCRILLNMFAYKARPG